MHFNPRPPRGGRRGLFQNGKGGCLFQSTPPARGATWLCLRYSHKLHHFNPRPPRGGRPFLMGLSWASGIFQSTPPARGATTFDIQVDDITGISIHAPREGGDSKLSYVFTASNKFQSTPPARGATQSPFSGILWRGYFNPRPPRGGRRYRPCFTSRYMEISIHAPREGGDVGLILTHHVDTAFQSTPPARGATPPGDDLPADCLFQSTPPARGATAKMHSFTCGSLTNK